MEDSVLSELLATLKTATGGGLDYIGGLFGVRRTATLDLDFASTERGSTGSPGVWRFVESVADYRKRIVAVVEEAAARMAAEPVPGRVMGMSETPTESLIKIRRDIAAGLLDAESSRAALSRMIYIQHDLKHGPGGSGRSGPCDADCVKCEAEEEIKRLPMSVLVAKTPPADIDPAFAGVYAAAEAWSSSNEHVTLYNRPDRPDGFSQAAVDAARAVLLAPAAKRGAR